MLERLGPCQAALALLVRQLVDIMQLPQHPLLIACRQPVETGIAAQHLLLLIDRKTLVPI